MVLHGNAKYCGGPFGSGCHHASSSMFDSWCHAQRNHPFSNLTMYKKQRFESSTHCNGFLTVFSSHETKTSLLPPVLGCAWSCCPLSHQSHKLLTQKRVFWFCCAALGLPDLFLSVSSSVQVPFKREGNCSHWLFGFLCSFSEGKTFRGYNGVFGFLC